MTALTSTDRPARAGASWGHRIVNVLKVHVANPWPTLITPWLIYLAIFGVNLAIWLAVVMAAGGRDQLEPEAFGTNGGVTWIYIYLLVVAVQAMNLTFAFVLGLGMTRRDYYAGTALYFLGLSTFFAAGVTALGGVESLTDGWGVQGYFFTPWVLQDLPAWQQFLVHLLFSLFFFAIGLIAGSLWVRWRVIGLYAMFGGLAVMLIVLIFAASAFDWWGDVGRFFTDNSVLTIVSWTLPVTLAAGAGGFALLRKATPRG